MRVCVVISDENVTFMGCSGSHLGEESAEEENEAPEEEQITVLNSHLEDLLKSRDPKDLFSAFLHLEKVIQSEENQCLSSIFGEAMSRQHQVKAHLEMALEEKNKNEFFSEEYSIEDLFTDLRLKNSKVAVEQEEFVARINRRALNLNAIAILENMLKEIEDQIKAASKRICLLQNAYHEQARLLRRVFGEAYRESEKEKALERELDQMLYYRDMLSIGVLQWVACRDRVARAAKLATSGVASWKLIKNQAVEQKIKHATAARDCLHEAIIYVQVSQELLVDVQFPYCTLRELRGVAQALDYIFTDILIEGRYSHATEVYNNLLNRANLLTVWIKEVLQSQLKKDLLDIEQKISGLTNEIRQERVQRVGAKLKIPAEHLDFEFLPETPANKMFSRNSTASNPRNFDFPINLESKRNLGPSNHTEPEDIKDYFQRLLEYRKDTIWPSRKIDDLRNLMIS